MENLSTFWAGVREFVHTRGSEWYAADEPHDHQTPHALIKLYFTISHCIYSQKFEGLKPLLQEFSRLLDLAPDHLVGIFLVQLYPRLPDEFALVFHHQLDRALSTLFCRRNFTSFDRLFVKLKTPTNWAQLIPNTLKLIVRQPEVLTDTSLVHLLGSSSEELRSNFQQYLRKYILARSLVSEQVREAFLSKVVNNSLKTTLSPEELESLEHASKTSPKSIFLLGKLHELNDRNQEAALMAWLAFNMGDFTTGRLYDMFMIFSAAGKDDLARKVALAYLAKDDQDLTGANQVGWKLIALGDLKHAEAAFQKIINGIEKNSPEWKDAQIGMLRARIDEISESEFMDRFNLVNSFNDKPLSFHSQVLRTLIRFGHYNIFLQEYQKYSLHSHPSDEYIILYVKILAKDGKIDNALDVLIERMKKDASPNVLRILLALAIQKKRSRKYIQFIRTQTPMNTETRALLIIALTECNLHAEAAKTYDPLILEIEDRQLMTQAVRSYLECLVVSNHWDQVYAFLKKSPPSLLRSKWARTYFHFANIFRLSKTNPLDTSAIALSFERILSYPLDRRRLRDLAAIFQSIKNRNPSLDANWRFKDIEDYILLHITDMVERYIDKMSYSHNEDEIRLLREKLSYLHLETVGELLIENISDNLQEDLS